MSRTEIKLELPWPPSVNHYWGRRRGGGMYVKERGLIFRAAVRIIVLDNKAGKTHLHKKRLRMVMDVHPPDRRERDLDNINKALWDALAEAEVYVKDYQIDAYSVQRKEVIKGGKVVVTITELEARE